MAQHTYFEGVDTNVRIQDDFDNAMNASWKLEHPIPDKYPRYTNFTVLTERMESIMKEMCIDQTNVLLNKTYTQYMSQNDETLKSHIYKKVEMMENVDSISGLIEYLSRCIVQGDYRLFHIYHGGTCRNPTFNIPRFNFNGLSLPDKSYYENEDDVSSKKVAFMSMINTLFTKLDLDTTHLTTIWEIERFISETHYTRAEKRNPLKTYHPTTLTQLVSMLGDQFSCLTSILPTEYHDITVNNIDLVERFSAVYGGKFTLEQLKTWHIWKIVRSYVGSSIGDLYSEYFRFYGTTMTGTKEPRPLEERAVLFVKSMFDDEMSRVYMDKYANPRLVIEFPKFVETLRGTLRNKLINLPWMTSNTKTKAIDKLDSMTLKVVGPTKYKDYSYFERDFVSVYELIDFSRKWDWDVLEVHDKMYKLHDHDSWEMAAVDVNAYYHPYYNEIVFPAGILQSPFYDPDAEYGDNAGGIGAVICHEMTHGFDDEGSKYDKNGYLHNWWTNKDRAEYEVVISNMETYFNGLSYKQQDLNGRLTQGENLADLGGLKCAIASCPDDKQQRICMEAWARTWRANIRDEYAKQMTIVDPHSLPRFRINGILPHVPEFYDIFDVKEGDGMYLDIEKRCRLYD